jgi:hypothetical protein
MKIFDHAHICPNHTHFGTDIVADKGFCAVEGAVNLAEHTLKHVVCEDT